MRRIGLAVVLTISLLFAPCAVEAQQPGKVSRLGYLSTTSLASPEGGSVLETIRQVLDKSPAG